MKLSTKRQSCVTGEYRSERGGEHLPNEDNYTYYNTSCFYKLLNVHVVVLNEHTALITDSKPNHIIMPKLSI